MWTLREKHSEQDRGLLVHKQAGTNNAVSGSAKPRLHICTYKRMWRECLTTAARLARLPSKCVLLYR